MNAKLSPATMATFAAKAETNEPVYLFSWQLQQLDPIYDFESQTAVTSDGRLFEWIANRGQWMEAE